MRNFRTLSTLLLAVILGGCADISSQPQVRAPYYRIVSLPDVPLQSKPMERIESVDLVMRGGRFMAINRLPEGWSGEVVAGSAPATLRLQARSRSSALRRSADLEGFVTVVVNDPAAFEIAGTLSVCSLEQELPVRQISLKRSDLIVQPLPNPLAQRPTGRSSR
jgi:hypothetical protein